MVDDLTNELVKKSKEQVVSSLSSISLTELKKLTDDEEYREDTLMTSENYLRICKKKSTFEDQALKLSNENIKVAEQLEGDLQVYTETVRPLYEE